MKLQEKSGYYYFDVDQTKARIKALASQKGIQLKDMALDLNMNPNTIYSLLSDHDRRFLSMDNLFYLIKNILHEELDNVIVMIKKV